MGSISKAKLIVIIFAPRSIKIKLPCAESDSSQKNLYRMLFICIATACLLISSTYFPRTIGGQEYKNK